MNIKKLAINSLYIGFLILAFGLTGCKKYLEVKPTNELTISTYDDVKALLGAHLKTFESGRNYLSAAGISPFYMGSQEYLYAHFYSDEFDINLYMNFLTQNNSADFVPSLKWEHEFAPGEIWEQYYKSIGFYNMILSELRKNSSGDKERDEQIAGEAKILRAWYFFRLMQYFMPYNEAQLGLPLNTDPDAVGSYDSRRKTQAENYDFLISELNEVLSYSFKVRSEYNIFYDERIAHALLAQIYLHKGGSGAKQSDDYDKAILHAKKVLDSGLDYTILRPVLPTSADSPQIFGGTTKRKHALFVAIQGTNEMEYVWGVPYYEIPQYPSKELLELFQPNDKRYRRNFREFDDGLGIVKYEATFLYAYSMYEFFTAAEMKLIIAESYARKGDEASALRELTEFASSRYEGYQRNESKTVLQNILDERRREFCFDFTMRWLDLTRLQTGFKRSLRRAGQEDQVFEIKDNDHHFCMPIPNKEERIENPIPQNPGWTGF
ncbi:RagB/SusD family nutrient uptake outer membrane protein [Porphyromonas cangingivalis]|uniref:RagB/SusD family nutrient uptake outer membrane protein n=1 Tax=Porphyromonas cangingivalis TaxID=36874 RepID=UPI00242B38BD|nr:RagB/SusD family nutrient uptake outer membrane protein [Porphyromonas cangingivalis]